MKRILIIDANTSNATDFIRAQRLVCQFLEDAPKYEKGLGRHHCIAYGRDDTVVVWQTATQITVRFCK